MTQPASPPRPAASKSEPADGSSPLRTLTAHADVRTLSLLGVLAVLVLIGGITQPDSFLDTDNVQLILTQASVIGVVTVGMTFVIISGGIDLSVGAIVALAGVWATTLATQSYGAGGMIFTAIVVGTAVGVVNGVLISYGRLVAFIATLAMMVAARGLAAQISGKQTQVSNNSFINSIASTDVLGIPLLV
ncbi:MAG: ABC transporter permease, partial [Streptomyces sp.]